MVLEYIQCPANHSASCQPDACDVVCVTQGEGFMSY